MTIMYTEDEEYEEYLSWRDDMDSVERYLDRIESQMDAEIERYNQSGIESWINVAVRMAPGMPTNMGTNSLRMPTI